MGISFLHPWQLLWGMPVLGFILFLILRSRSGLDPFRLWLTGGIRLAAAAALVMALSGVQRVRTHDELSVAFLLDCSKSIPPAERQKALDQVNAACLGMKEKDQAALIPFGTEPVLETSFGRRLDVPRISSVLKGDRTDLASAMRLASAAFPPGTMRRIVLVTDGNENAGSVLDEAAQLKASGVSVDVLPLEYAFRNEVMMESLLVPTELNRDEAMEAKLVVWASREGPANVSFYQNHQLVARQTGVPLKAGKNVLSVPRRLSGNPDEPNRAGFYAFEAFVEAEGDQRPENNRAHAFTVVRGDARVLLIEGKEHEERWMAEAFAQEGFAVDRRTPDRLGSLGDLQAYDAVVLGNVSVEQLPRDLMEGLPSAVRDLGVGLVMIGGDRSFGAGGWHQTGIEEVLPVSMDLTQRKVVPNGALVIILHTCEFENGNAWAKEIAKVSLDSLSPQDFFGELDFGPGADQWGIPMQKVGDKKALKAKIQGLGPQDMMSFANIFSMAHQALKPIKAGVKHCVLISDGDPQPPTQAQVKAMLADKITISTVGIGPHGGGEMAELQTIADWGGGKFYNVKDPAHLPKIFAKEAQVVRRSLLCEESFLPRLKYSTDLMKGISHQLPQLHGYVCTTPKEKAQLPIVSHQGDPILAHWRIGLGKSVAFTSDAKNAWGRDWIVWSDYKRFWAQTLRWVLRSAPKSTFQVQTGIKEGEGKVIVDALDDQGRFVNDLAFQGRVSDPDPEKGGQALSFAQTGPGRYEASFEASSPGAYYVGFGYQGGGENGQQGVVTTGAAVSYSPEFKDLKTNHALLARLAEASGGRLLKALDPLAVFAHDLPKPKTASDLWRWMLQIALWGFFLDVALRRVLIGRRELAAVGRRSVAWMPGVGRRFRVQAPTREETLSSLLARKAEVQRKEDEEVRRYEASATDLAAGAALKNEEEAGKGLGKGLTPKAALPPTPTLGQKPEAPMSYTERLLEAKRKALDEDKRKKGG